MPSLMMHIKVGYEIGKKINLNSYNYYLGLIAPDAPNLHGFAPKIERWTAHIREKDLNDWRNKLNEFYFNNQENYNKEFLIGYYIHILTDIIFDDYFYFDIRKKVIQDNIQEDIAHDVMSNDINNYYFEEYQEVKDILESSNLGYNINNISSELLLSWKDKTTNRNITTNESKYITEEEILELVNQVYKETLMNKILV